MFSLFIGLQYYKEILNLKRFISAKATKNPS